MSKHSESHWISLSDMMTSLMMVFLLISILMMYQTKKEQQKQQQIVLEYKNSKEALYQELNNKFKNKFSDWEMALDNNLTVKFTNPDSLFEKQSSVLSPKFREILTDFIPEYLKTILKKEYRNRIEEVSIEGHTAYWDDYMYSVNLSQKRANSVLYFILNTEYYKNLNKEEKEIIRYWVTANGLGFGRALDSEGKLVHDTDQAISPLSRRVEFRIVTADDKLIKQIMDINKLNK